MKLCSIKWSLKNFIRALIITVTTLGVASILSALILFTVTSFALRIVIIGVGVTLVAVSILAWRLTGMESSQQSTSVIYLRSYRRGHSWPSCQLHPVPDYCQFSQTPPCSWLASSERLSSSYTNIESPPPYENTTTSISRGEPPPIYTVSKNLSRLMSMSPPPQYTPRSYASNYSQSVPYDRTIRSYIRIIDCSKAVPTAFEIHPAVTSF